MAVGVNGTGKTTTIGKLAWHLQKEFGAQRPAGRRRHLQGRRRRAARGMGRSGPAARSSPGAEGSDPGAVAFEAIARGRAEQFDVVIIDTAGRLHTQDDLMGELSKVRRVISRQLEGAPHETLLTLDATTGQNGLRQARMFAEAAGVTGVVLTKLDGTARGGIALAIASELAAAGEADRNRRVRRGPAAVRCRRFCTRVDRRELTSLLWPGFSGLSQHVFWASGRCTRAASTCSRSRSARPSRRSSACSAWALC